MGSLGPCKFNTMFHYILLLLVFLTPCQGLSNLKIISMRKPEDMSVAPCALTCAGISKGHWTDSTTFFRRSYTSISIRGCGFISDPIITTSIRSFRQFPGPGHVYWDANTEIFSVYTEEGVYAKAANADSWTVHWIAIGFQC